MDIPRRINDIESLHCIHNPPSLTKLPILGAVLRLKSGTRALGSRGRGAGLSGLDGWARIDLNFVFRKSKVPVYDGDFLQRCSSPIGAPNTATDGTGSARIDRARAVGCKV
jgi:hypothetical protein